MYSKKSAGEISPATMAVLDGEIAVPCNLQAATAGLITSLRGFRSGAALGKCR